MASNIDITKPVAGSPTTSSVRDNFSAAKTEIEALQTSTANQVDLSSDQSISNKNYREKDTEVTGTSYALSGTGIRRWTLTANSTVTDSLSNGDGLLFFFGASAFDVTSWPSGTKFIGGVKPSPDASDVVVWSAYKAGGVLYVSEGQLAVTV